MKLIKFLVFLALVAVIVIVAVTLIQKKPGTENIKADAQTAAGATKDAAVDLAHASAQTAKEMATNAAGIATNLMDQARQKIDDLKH